MIDALAQALLQYTARQPGPGPYLTAIEGMGILRSDQPRPPVHLVSRPSICIVAQGAKRASFGTGQLEYRRGQALVVGVETPQVGQVFQASPGAPCLVLALALDLALLREVAGRLDPPPRPVGDPARGVFVADVDGPLADCALRLVRLLDTPAAVPVLAPLAMQELCYWLLAGPQGGQVLRLAQSNPSPRLVAALHALRRDYRKPLRVEALAARARMSATVFHRQFKALTSLSPLQYVKQLRLMEARRLLVAGEARAETAAFAVGYESASQFSREYARMFGAPPRRDVQRVLAAGLGD